MIRSALLAIVDAIVGAVVPSESDYTPVERITNGGFDSGTGWTISGASWVIGSGVATNASFGTISQILVTGSVLPSGGSVAISLVVGGVTGGRLTVALYRSGVSVQQIYKAVPAAGTLTLSATADAEWDTILFEGFNAVGLTIDNISVIA